MTRTIFHLDLDSFYVSAERLRDPSLRGVPLAVGGTGPRAVISSASYEARAFGVRSAMPVARAMRLCPRLTIRTPDFTLYSALSKKVFSLFEQFTPIWENVSIDEGYLDMTGTGSLFGPPLSAAALLRKKILCETGLTASIGIAANRLVAKIATDACKPDNVLQIAVGEEAAFLAPLSASRLPGVGKVTAAWLSERGVNTIEQLQRYPLDVLERRLGRHGRYLHDSAWGRGSVEFHEEAKNPSISRETTFDDDVGDAEKLRRELWSMSTDLGRQLRETNAFARGLRLKLRYPPFRTVTRSRALDIPTQADSAIFDTAVALFEENWQDASPLRLIGVGCVLGEAERQLNLFDSKEDQNNRKEFDRLKDSLAKRFGPNSLKTGRDFK